MQDYNSCYEEKQQRVRGQKQHKWVVSFIYTVRKDILKGDIWYLSEYFSRDIEKVCHHLGDTQIGEYLKRIL